MSGKLKTIKVNERQEKILRETLKITKSVEDNYATNGKNNQEKEKSIVIVREIEDLEKQLDKQ